MNSNKKIMLGLTATLKITILATLASPTVAVKGWSASESAAPSRRACNPAGWA